MPMLLDEVLSKDCRIGVFLACLLSMVNIENFSIVFGQILKLDMQSFGLLTPTLISSFTIS